MPVSRLALERLARAAMGAKEEFSTRYFRRVSVEKLGEALHRMRVWAPARRLSDAIDRAAIQVHSIGMGRKIAAGKLTRTLCVRIYVTQKLPLSLIPKAARIPGHIAGVPTDVVESPPAFLALPAPPCTLRKTRLQRPLCPGISASNAAVNAGTIAALCRSTRPGETTRRYLLGNNHTFADLGAAVPGSAILQPSPRDGGKAADQVASLARFTAIDERDTASNRVDAAIAELVTGAAFQSDVCCMGSPQGVAEPRVGLGVQKHGRTTGFSLGIIDDVSVDVVVPLSRSQPQRVARFVQQVRIRPAPGMSVFAAGGDSGSLVTTRNGNKAVGMLFACPDDGSFAIANPIGAVFAALQIDFA
jgi:hypothetical protein